MSKNVSSVPAIVETTLVINGNKPPDVQEERFEWLFKGKGVCITRLQGTNVVCATTNDCTVSGPDVLQFISAPTREDQAHKQLERNCRRTRSARSTSDGQKEKTRPPSGLCRAMRS